MEGQEFYPGVLLEFSSTDKVGKLPNESVCLWEAKLIVKKFCFEKVIYYCDYLFMKWRLYIEQHMNTFLKSDIEGVNFAVRDKIKFQV